MHTCIQSGCGAETRVRRVSRICPPKERRIKQELQTSQRSRPMGGPTVPFSTLLQFFAMSTLKLSSFILQGIPCSPPSSVMTLLHPCRPALRRPRVQTMNRRSDGVAQLCARVDEQASQYCWSLPQPCQPGPRQVARAEVPEGDRAWPSRPERVVCRLGGS